MPLRDVCNELHGACLPAGRKRDQEKDEYLVQKISTSLEAIADLVDHASDLPKIQAAIQTAKTLAKEASLQQLETELNTWQSKLSVILNEPAGKKGMAKHARFWAEKLKAIHV